MNALFQILHGADGIAWLTFDTPGRSANILTGEALDALEQALIDVAQTHPSGLVILSGKSTGFIAGADVESFARVGNAEQAKIQIEHAHEVLHRLESLAFPTVALIHGYCLGGGLELALACRFRVACDDPATRLGFPEVRLGIFPGFGGTVRSLRLLGHLRALQLMLSGRSLGARQALDIGLVDQAVPSRQLRSAARQLIAVPPQRRAPPWPQRLAAWAPLRPLVAAALHRRVRVTAPPAHFPAPHALIEHWRRHAGNPGALYRGEAKAVAELITGPTAQNLIRVFLLQERLKGQGNRAAFSPRHVHVVGSGVMGGDIAAWCALQGLRVTLQDRTPADLTRAMQRAQVLFRRQLRDPYRVQGALDRLMPDHRGDGVPLADVVIEAIFEDAAAKQALYAGLEPRLRPDAVLASNTSSIPLEVLGAPLARPNRIVGLHFFNPVAKMQLVEVVCHADTEPQMLHRASAFARRIDKLPLPVRSSPGFLVNRVLMPYLLEAVELLEEGVPAAVIDRAALAFGMPLGPVELADTVGLDICLAVADKMTETLRHPVPERLQALVAAGHLGRKSGRGFYAWRGARPDRPKVAPRYRPPPDLADRLVLRLINEAVACLREGVVGDADLLDAGVIFGTGFAPFRGGPLHYARGRGAGEVRDRLQQLERNHGSHFHVDDGWAAVT